MCFLGMCPWWGWLVLLAGAVLFFLMIYWMHQYAIELGDDIRRNWRR